MSILPIAVCQMTSVDDTEANFAQIEKFVREIQFAKIAFFPENCLYMRLKEGQKIEGLALDDNIFLRLAQLAQNHQIALHLGSLPLREQGKLSNATIFVSRDGQVYCTYRKTHLFDIALEGQTAIRESDVFNHGLGASVLEFEGVRIGQTICYDLRFAELFSQYAKKGVEIIVVPSAFLVSTGMAHWEVLLRARAIESQTFVVAAAQAGIHRSFQGERQTFGHSLVVSPWGEVLAKGSADKVELIEMTLDLKLVEKIRRQIPMSLHRRL